MFSMQYCTLQNRTLCPSPVTKCKKATWLSEEALQIAEKRRDVEGKGEKERYIHLNAEFQRIARKYKKPS